MQWLVVLAGLIVLSIISLGVYYDRRHPAGSGVMIQRRWKRIALTNLLALVAVATAVLVWGIQDALAAAEGAGSSEISVGLGLALIGIGLPTGLAAIGGGVAVSAVGAASLAVIAEKPEMFGRTLIYLGLAEGIAIYGLVVTILLLGKIG